MYRGSTSMGLKIGFLAMNRSCGCLSASSALGKRSSTSRSSRARSTVATGGSCTPLRGFACSLRRICRASWRQPVGTGDSIAASRLSPQLSEHVRQNAAVVVVLALDGSVDARDRAEPLDRSVRGCGLDLEPLAGVD